MHPIKRLLLVGATVIALAAAVPSVSAGSHKDFHLDKTCAEDPSEPLGYFCTVQHSDFRWIPPGTEVHYAAIPPLDPLVVQAVTIKVKNGSTQGVCVWSSLVNAVCTFSGGTGRLTQFHLTVDVTANADQSVWYWDGTSWFGHHHGHG